MGSKGVLSSWALTLFVGLQICSTLPSEAQESKTPTGALTTFPKINPVPTFNPPPSGLDLGKLQEAGRSWMNKLNSNALSLGGTQGGGGGTFVESTDERRPLVFWDLYAQNPNFTESRVGEPIRWQKSESAEAHGEWLVGTDTLAAGRFLESRLELMKTRMPNLTNLLHAGMYDLRIFLTDYSITAIREISVPAKLTAQSRKTAIPGAFYHDEAEWAYLDIKAWNRAGPVSQAALLLHEHLRRVQHILGLSNDEIQQAVSYLLTASPQSRSPIADSRFKDKEPALTGLANLFGISTSALHQIPPKDVTSYALKILLLRDGPLERLQVKDEGYRNAAPANGGVVLLDAASCASVVRNNGELLLGDLECDRGVLLGEGFLNFETSWSEYTIEVGVSGFDFGLKAAGVELSITGGGMDDWRAILTANKIAKEISVDVGSDSVYSLHVSRTRVDFFLGRTKLGSWPLPRIPQDGKWQFWISSRNAAVSFIRILPR